MNSKLKFICTDSADTIVSANELGIDISEITNKIQVSGMKEKANAELEKALDKIFGDDYFDAGDYEYDEKPVTRVEIEETLPEPIAVEPEPVVVEPIQEPEPPEPELSENDATRHASLASISLEKELLKAIEGHAPEEDEYCRTKSETYVVFDDDGNDITEEVKKCILATEKLPTLYIQRNIRSGQSISYDGNIVIIGSAHAGCEVIASGDITVWGILGGIAHAGASIDDKEFNRYARIRALKMNAIQLRIADIFARRPDTVNMPYVQKTDTYVPEEASIKNSRIIIQKLHEE
jgi:septum site-determining protein MinC